MALSFDLTVTQAVQRSPFPPYAGADYEAAFHMYAMHLQATHSDSKDGGILDTSLSPRLRRLAENQLETEANLIRQRY